VAEGARLESVFTRKGNVGSNPTLSAILFKINELLEFQDPLSGSLFVFGMSDMQFCKAQVRAVKAKTDRLGISFSIGEGWHCPSGHVHFNREYSAST
jgi:hypothetical protein